MVVKIVTGKQKKPHNVIIYGPDGVGKTSFGAAAPKPIFLGPESGTDQLDVARFETPTSWKMVLDSVNQLMNDSSGYQTLVIDSLDWLEPLLHAKICADCGAKSIELAHGGYGKGYTDAVNGWIDFIRLLGQLRDKQNMNIISVAHSEVVKFSDPSTQSEYDRYQIKLYKKSSALWREFVDSVLFANFEVFTKKDGQKTRAFGEGGRVIYPERRPGFDAKNRFGLSEPMPLSFQEYDAATKADRSKTPDALREQITELAEQVNPEIKKLVLETTEKAGNNIVTLTEIVNRLLVRINA